MKRNGGIVMEEKKKELKPRSFRLSDEVFNRVKDLSKEICGNQEEVLVQLIQAFELEQGKSLLPDRKKEITDFQNYTELLTKMFMHSLEDYATLEQKILLQYEDKLCSKDETISDLQRKVTELKQIKENAIATAKEKTDENCILSKELEETEREFLDKIARLEGSLQDKEGLIEEVKEGKSKANEQIASLTMELTSSRMQLSQIDEINNELTDVKKQIRDLEYQNTELKKEKEQADESHQRELDLIKKNEKNILDECEKNMEYTKQYAEMEKKRALLEQEKKLREEISQKESLHKAEIEKYQKKIEELLVRIEKNSENRRETEK